MDKKYTIFIIDDKIGNLQYLSSILEDDYDIRASLDSKLAISALDLVEPDLILLDIKMPDIDGYEVCKLIKSKEELSEIPIIFISAFDDVKHKVRAFENGGVDYITKPFEKNEVLARVKTQIKLSSSKKTISNLLKQQDLFIKKIMHEMNTPMSIISLNTQSLEKQLGEKEEFDSIKGSIKTLSSIYEDLSYMIKKESKVYDIKRIELLPFISSRIIFFNEMSKIKDINIDLEFSKEFSININEYELERIIDNTLSNAIKYSKSETCITIYIGEEDKKSILSIKDEGIGIPPDTDIFLPYYQQSKKTLGLGLGLAIVKEICTKYNINIELQSKENIGTTFTYDFTNILHKQSL